MFRHEYAKIPRHTSKNASTEGDFICIFACNCEGTERLRRRNKEEGGKKMHEFDDAVLMCFLKKQSQLFPEEDVASNLEEAEAFLEECMAVVVESAEEVKEYFEEEGIDMDGADLDEILEADEVFEVGDGRYLIVEG